MSAIYDKNKLKPDYSSTSTNADVKKTHSKNLTKSYILSLMTYNSGSTI